MIAPCAASVSNDTTALTDGAVSAACRALPMSGPEHQAGYVLHYSPFRDTSFIVDLFTLEYGRVAVVARGARGAKSRSRALYQPFRPLLLSWTGQSEFRTLTGIEDSGAAFDLDNRALACAYYVNELLLRLVGKDQAQAQLFGHYVVCLADLARSGSEPAAASPEAASATDTTQARVPLSMEANLRAFEVQLLEALGLLPDLVYSQAGGEPLNPELQYRFYPGRALSVALPAEGQALLKSVSGAQLLHEDGVTEEESVVVHGSTLLAIARLEFVNDAVLAEARQVMRRLLRIHLGGQPLKSRGLFDALVRVAPAAAPRIADEPSAGTS